MKITDLPEKEIEVRADDIVLIDCEDCNGNGQGYASCSESADSCCYSCTSECDNCNGTGKASIELWQITEQEFEFEN